MANFERLFEMIPVLQNTFNSVFTAILGTVTSLFFCSLAGFAFAKYSFPGRNALFYFVIGTMLVPPEVGAVPLFVIMKKIGLINSLWSLIIPRIATAVGIFYMHQYIKDVPDELIEAAKIDGCGDFKIFLRIIIPVIKPALASWASVTLIARWNDFFWPLVIPEKAGKIYTDGNDLTASGQRRTFYAVAGDSCRNNTCNCSDCCAIFITADIPESRSDGRSRKKAEEITDGKSK